MKCTKLYTSTLLVFVLIPSIAFAEKCTLSGYDIRIDLGLASSAEDSFIEDSNGNKQTSMSPGAGSSIDLNRCLAHSDSGAEWWLGVGGSFEFDYLRGTFTGDITSFSFEETRASQTIGVNIARRAALAGKCKRTGYDNQLSFSAASDSADSSIDIKDISTRSIFGRISILGVVGKQTTDTSGSDFGITVDQCLAYSDSGGEWWLGVGGYSSLTISQVNQLGFSSPIEDRYWEETSDTQGIAIGITMLTELAGKCKRAGHDNGIGIAYSHFTSDGSIEYSTGVRETRDSSASGFGIGVDHCLASSNSDTEWWLNVLSTAVFAESKGTSSISTDASSVNVGVGVSVLFY